jgi:cysteinyl-tRNA synthetase
VETYPEYLKLSGRNLEEMQAGARVEVGEKKKNAMDFALWKSSKPGEPWWESPWGKGRPGWHIECSAMSMEFLGKTFDFHGGGKDLIFPHHENEIAQSEAANGCCFVRYWLHNGFVNINSEKMSKSLGNFFTIREVLKSYDPETLRFFILSAHYRSPIDFSDQNLNEAQLGLERMYSCLAAMDEILAGSAQVEAAPDQSRFSPVGVELLEKKELLIPRFREAMDDDFNTALSLGVLFEVVRGTNRFMAETKVFGVEEKALLAGIRGLFIEAGNVLGILGSKPAEWLGRIQSARAGQVAISSEEIDALIMERAEARKNRNFSRGDEIRDMLLEQGIQLLDSAQGTTWKVK